MTCNALKVYILLYKRMFSLPEVSFYIASSIFRLDLKYFSLFKMLVPEHLVFWVKVFDKKEDVFIA